MRAHANRGRSLEALGFLSMGNPVIVVLGAGPGVGGAVARRFGQAGYDAALISRDPDQLQALEQLQSEGFTTGWTALDLTDADAVAAAVTRFGDHAGTIDHLHFNPSAFRQKTPLPLRKTAPEPASDSTWPSNILFSPTKEATNSLAGRL